MPVKILSGSEMGRRLAENMESSPQHVIGQTIGLVRQALESGQIQEGWTVTYYDEEEFYCLAVVRGGKLRVLCKTAETITREDLH